MTTAVKLSSPQIQALHEIYAKTIKANITAKPNTIESLWKKGLIFFDKYIQDPAIFLTEEGKRAIGMADEPEDVVEEIQDELHENVEETLSGGESGNVGDPSNKLGLTNDPALADWELELANLTREDVERFDHSRGQQTNTYLGFGEVYNWNNPKVWDGLTAEEIREDMDTAAPINRKAKRAHFRMLRNASRRLQGKQGRNRKAIKICGGVG